MSTNQAEFYRGLEHAGRALSRCADTTATARATAVHEALQPLLAQTHVAAQLDCASGCSHCCHFPVGVTYPEAMRLAATIRTDLEQTDRLLQANEQTRELAWHELVGHACPLLHDDACVVYESRPIPCRALGSLDRSACSLALTTETSPPRDEAAWWRGLGAVQALATAQPDGSRELRSAVAAILRAAPDESAAAFRAARMLAGTHNGS